jgi:D-alanyl-lipoteichoic acid acyltransferase DltB (MBOAT superfamily)
VRSILYAVKKHSVQNFILLIFSYTFYGLWDIRFLPLLIISTLIDWYAGVRIYSAGSAREKKRYLILSISLNLGLLFLFKYLLGLQEEVCSLANMLGFQVNFIFQWLVIPLGISYYTFQTISYTMDIYGGRITPASLLDFALYVSFFPQLAGGPIETTSNLLRQIQSPKRRPRYMRGLTLLLQAYFKKYLIVNLLWDQIYPILSFPHWYTGGDYIIALLGLIGYLYADMSAYADIAVGSGAILGFDIIHNFAQTSLAKDMQDFWQRCHISVYRWFYIYVYLNVYNLLFHRVRFNPARLAVMVNFLGIALWHGAGLRFLLLGLIHGLAVIFTQWLNKQKRRWSGRFALYFSVINFALLVSVGWIINPALLMIPLPYLGEGLSTIFSSGNGCISLSAEYLCIAAYSSPVFPLQLSYGVLVFCAMILVSLDLIQKKYNEDQAAIMFLPIWAKIPVLSFLLAGIVAGAAKYSNQVFQYLLF